MKLVIDQNSLTSNGIILEHGKVTIKWNSNPYIRTEFANGIEVFTLLNNFWARMPEAKQNEMFKLYQDIRQTLDLVSSIEQLTQMLKPMVTRLLDDFHDLDEIEYFITFNGNINIPQSTKETVVFEPGSNITPEKTYLRGEYLKLAALAIAVRSLLPIWSEFIYRTQTEAGKDFKEYRAARLMLDSKAMESEAMHKLTTYVSNQLQADPQKSGSALASVSSDEYLPWVLYRVLVRRLCVGDLRGQESDIVAFIYKFIRARNTSEKQTAKGSKFGVNTVIRDRKQDNSTSQDTEDTLSVLEWSKILEQLTIGDVGILKHYFKSQHFANKFSWLDPVILSESIRSVQKLQNYDPERCQVALAQYALKGIISPRALMITDINVLLMVMGFTQAALWQSGHKELAALMTSIAQQQQDEYSISGSVVADKLPRKTVEILNELWPYSKYSSSRRTFQMSSPCAQAIDNLTTKFTAFEWRMTIPDRWMSEFDPPRTVRNFLVDRDIRILLADLAIHLATRPLMEAL